MRSEIGDGLEQGRSGFDLLIQCPHCRAEEPLWRFDLARTPPGCAQGYFSPCCKKFFATDVIEQFSLRSAQYPGRA